MRSAVYDTTGFISRTPRAGKEDDLEDLMAIIDGPAEGEEGEEGEEVDPEIAEFLGEPIVPAAEDEEEEEPAAAAAAAPAPAVGVDNNQAIGQLAQLLAQREQRELEAARRADEAARGAAPVEAPLYSDDQTTLTPEEAAVYEQSRPTIEKLVRAELAKYHATTQPKFASTIAELRENLSAVQPQLDQSHDTAFAATLRASVPDLDARVKSPAWKEYLAKPIPFKGGRTFGQALHDAVNVTRDVGAALEIVTSFQPPVAADPPKPGKAPGRASGGGAPASVAASVRKAGTQPTKVPYSKFARATELVQAGKLAPDKYQKISDYYMDAHEAGLVDYNT